MTDEEGAGAAQTRPDSPNGTGTGHSGQHQPQPPAWGEGPAGRTEAELRTGPRDPQGWLPGPSFRDAENGPPPPYRRPASSLFGQIVSPVSLSYRKTRMHL